MMATEIVIFDLDDTLYDCAHRDHLAKAKQWDEFHSLLGEDKINNHVKRILLALAADPDTVVVILTARNEKFRKMTIDKLRADSILQHVDRLLMRPDDNFMKSPDVKMMLLERFLVNFGYSKNDILCAFEDREDVAERFIAEQIKVIMVTK
jgi:FMN phosphatase YigB (HAD superfamily)